MKFWKSEKQEHNCEEWHDKFAWWPTQVSDNLTVWLETYRRRVVREQGQSYHYEYVWIDFEGYVTNNVWIGPSQLDWWPV